MKARARSNSTYPTSEALAIFQWNAALTQVELCSLRMCQRPVHLPVKRLQRVQFLLLPCGNRFGRGSTKTARQKVCASTETEDEAPGTKEGQLKSDLGNTNAASVVPPGDS